MKRSRSQLAVLLMYGPCVLSACGGGGNGGNNERGGYRDEPVHAYGPFGDRTIPSHRYTTEQWPSAHHRRTT
jgi:hypothetical protein